jgi:hypothetical protein
MSRANEERYVFETEWFDIQASLIRKYLFTFYPADNTIEMVSQPHIHTFQNPLCDKLSEKKTPNDR